MSDAHATDAGRDVSRYMGMTMQELDELRIVGHGAVAPHLLGRGGSLRAGALLTMIDSVGGLNAGLAALPDGWVVSTNLAAQIVAPSRAGPLRFDSGLLRRGRNNVVTAVEVRDEGAADTLVASGVLTSAILVPQNGPPQWDRPLTLDTRAPTGPSPVPPVPEWLGVRMSDADAIEIDLAPELRNPWGILHGGVVAAVVDLAAEHVTGGGVTTDVVLHYLAPNRIGPIRAVARTVGMRRDGAVLRVEVCDVGAARTTAVAVVTCATTG